MATHGRPWAGDGRVGESAIHVDCQCRLPISTVGLSPPDNSGPTVRFSLSSQLAGLESAGWLATAFLRARGPYQAIYIKARQEVTLKGRGNIAIRFRGARCASPLRTERPRVLCRGECVTHTLPSRQRGMGGGLAGAGVRAGALAGRRAALVPHWTAGSCGEHLGWRGPRRRPSHGQAPKRNRARSFVEPRIALAGPLRDWERLGHASPGRAIAQEAAWCTRAQRRAPRHAPHAAAAPHPAAGAPPSAGVSRSRGMVPCL